MRIITKPNNDTEAGRILVVKHNTVMWSYHYRNINHYEALIKQIKQLLGEKI